MKRLLLAGALALAWGSAWASVPDTGVRITTTNVTASSSPSSASLNANSQRRYLALVNEGASTCRFQFGSAPGASTGWPIYSTQGYVFESQAMPLDALWVYCPSNQTITIMEGQ